jgi:hypothetical protein
LMQLSCSVPQNSFPLPTGSIFSFTALGSVLGKDYAGAIVTFFCGTLYQLRGFRVVLRSRTLTCLAAKGGWAF